MAIFTKDWKYRGEGNSSLVVANTVVSTAGVYLVSKTSLSHCRAMTIEGWVTTGIH